MAGDYSRFTFDRKNRFSRVLWQQGRVSLDSDHNEQSEIFTNRDRTFAHDVVGDAAVPRATTPDAFKITAAGANLNIGAGRIYIDGIVAEAFSSDPLTYATQPFYPDPPPLSGFPSVRSLAYLDVWERELTAVQETALLEPALHGIDTTVRTQTVWQVKIASTQDFPGLNCGTDLDTIFPPSTGRLTVQVDPPGDDPDPCALPEEGGFRGVENRHYRVEIHDVSTTSTTFKFSRDPISARIEEIRAGGLAGQTILKVVRTGRDSALRFSAGDRIEVLSERRVLRNEPGTMAKIVKVDDALLEITIDKVVTPASSTPDPRAWITKWDQDNALDPVNHLLTVTSGLIALESGISVEFTGTPRRGDYWMFPAREATHTAGPLVNAPPRGVIHHYAPLALIDFLPVAVASAQAAKKVTKKPAATTLVLGGGTSQPEFAPIAVASDCRTLWPPDCDCECAACVNPEDHGSGKWTIQMAIDKVSRDGGGKVCLEPGVYPLSRPLTILNTTSLRLTGHGRCNLLFLGNDPYALLIRGSNDIVIEHLALRRLRPSASEVSVITISNTAYGVVVRHCTLSMLYSPAGGTKFQGIGIALDVLVRDTKIIDCTITAPAGIAATSDPATKRTSLTVATDLEIRSNTITANDGIRLLAGSVAAVIRQNVITAASSGIRLEGTARTGRSNIIDANSVTTARTGIGVGADRTTVTNNLVLGTFTFNPDGKNLEPADQTYSSIAVYTESTGDLRRDCLVAGNRCLHTKGMGVLIADRVEALVVAENFIRHTAGGGIVALDKARDSTLTIEGNDIADVALGEDISFRSYGIHLGPLCHASVLANRIDGVGLPDLDHRPPFHQALGISADSPRSLRIHENTLSRITPSPAGRDETGVVFGSAAIYVAPPFGTVEITNNNISTTSVAATGHTYAIRVHAPPTYGYTVFTLASTVQNANQGQTVTAQFGAPGQSLGVVEQYAVAFTNYFWVRLGSATSLLLIGSNIVDCEGGLDEKQIGIDPQLGMVRVAGASLRCTFGDNICAHRFSGDLNLPIGVYLNAETVVANANQIFGRFSQPPLEVWDFHRLNLWTVLGNIVQGTLDGNNNLAGIVVNGNVLTDPPLNRVTL
ncbi:MAG TPA: DUF6519 domain-containing protein [Thermoanaerobaculia bacterium]|jgi:hypothetical protein|nr:DUF6519 domain-containing protein [Thermoanaerobaculia bacterium]